MPRQESKHSLPVVPPLGETGKYTFKAVAVSLPALGADQSEPDGFSANLNWHKQLMGHVRLFYASLFYVELSPWRVAPRGQDSLGGFPPSGLIPE